MLVGVVVEQSLSVTIHASGGSGGAEFVINIHNLVQLLLWHTQGIIYSSKFYIIS